MFSNQMPWARGYLMHATCQAGQPMHRTAWRIVLAGLLTHGNRIGEAAPRGCDSPVVALGSHLSQSQRMVAAQQAVSTAIASLALAWCCLSFPWLHRISWAILKTDSRSQLYLRSEQQAVLPLGSLDPP